jgi:metal-responsive CopG/Arc/MetJ family transcriptional regulator
MRHTIGMKYWEEAMATKVKVTVSLDAALVRELAEARRQSGKSRSRLMEEALHLWRRSQLDEELKRGYRAMAEEDRGTAERNLGATWEVVK